MSIPTVTVMAVAADFHRAFLIRRKENRLPPPCAMIPAQNRVTKRWVSPFGIKIYRSFTDMVIL